MIEPRTRPAASKWMNARTAVVLLAFATTVYGQNDKEKDKRRPAASQEQPHRAQPPSRPAQERPAPPPRQPAESHVQRQPAQAPSQQVYHPPADSSSPGRSPQGGMRPETQRP